MFTPFCLSSFSGHLFNTIKKLQKYFKIAPLPKWGEILKRGRSPLSLKHPSPARNKHGFLPMSLAGEGTGVR